MSVARENTCGVWPRCSGATLWAAAAGVGHFNNNFKVADDIRLLGAVPEEEEEREVPIDKHMAKAMEERLLKGIEQEMLRDKQAIIRSFMKDSTGAAPSLPVRETCAREHLLARGRCHCRVFAGGRRPLVRGAGTGRAGSGGRLVLSSTVVWCLVMRVADLRVSRRGMVHA